MIKLWLRISTNLSLTCSVKHLDYILIFLVYNLDIIDKTKGMVRNVLLL